MPSPRGAAEQCFGPALRSGLAGWELEEIRGKPWAVFARGGVFCMFNGINTNYAQVRHRGIGA
jgi:hypothetical protein